MLLATVTAGLEALWSPRQISKVLTELYPGVPSMNISHETIYQSIYVQGRGELRRELARCLRSGRAARQRQHRATTGQGIIPEMVMISQRPAEIEDRAIPGHWEGDLIIGKDGLSAVGTLVERSSRYVILLHLPKGRSADKVRDAMTSAIKDLPAHLCRSITWDQGKEMAEHKAFTTATDIQIYFCDPHSPWQRGSNENTNGLLRQYMPKGTDLSAHTPADLQRIADSLNDRPRETLNWATPHNTLHHLLVAHTA
jgi:IS30 family transposase